MIREPSQRPLRGYALVDGPADRLRLSGHFETGELQRLAAHTRFDAVSHNWLMGSLVLTDNAIANCAFGFHLSSYQNDVYFLRGHARQQVNV
jgi:hypothetical protein